MSRHYKLTAEQASATGFTDLFVIAYNDAALTAAVADNTAVAVTLDALALGDVVRQDVLIEPTVGWTGPSDLTATVSAGVTGTATALTPALTITTAGAATAISTTDTSDNQTNAHYAAAAAINLIATFTPDADSGVDEFTAGELRIWMNISRAAVRASLQA
jgi:hypothetical protein